MAERRITEEGLKAYEKYLTCEEKSTATLDKYLRDVRAFMRYTGGRIITKELVVSYKKSLQENYAARSVNSMLAGVETLTRMS